MSILSRVKNIMTSNIKSRIQNSKDPLKEVDLVLKELADDLGKAKSEIDSTQTIVSRLRRNVDELDCEIDKFDRYIEKAIENNRRDDEKIYARKKQNAESEKAPLMIKYNAAKDDLEKMKDIYSKLENNYDALNRRRNAVKIKMNEADMLNKQVKIEGDNFRAIENQADMAIYQAEAYAELNGLNNEDDDFDKLFAELEKDQ